MKFRFYIIDSDDASVTGTNDYAVADEAARCNTVIDTETNTLDSGVLQIPEQTTWKL